jgi:hypothetical protein
MRRHAALFSLPLTVWNAILMPATQLVHQRLRLLVGRINPTMASDMLVGIGLIVNLFVVLSARHFPYADAPNHLARYTVIERLLSGEPERDYSFHWIPTPYIGVDLIGACLVRLFGPMTAEKLLASAAVVLPIAGMYLLLRATAPRRRGWSLVAVLISFSWQLMAGLLNFVLGFGLVLCCLAWWWPRRDADGWSVPTIVAVMTFGLFFVHAWAPLFLLVVLAAAMIVKIPDLLAGGWWPHWAAIRLPALRTLLLGLMAFGAAWWWMTAFGERSADILGPWVFRTLRSKIQGFVGPFWVFSLKQAVLTATGYGVLLLIFLTKHARQPLHDPFFVAAGLFTFLYLVFPTEFGPGGVSNTDGRWLLLAYYLPFCLVAANASPESPKILAPALLFCLINTAVIASGVITIDRELDDYDAVLRQVPRGSRLLELANSPGRVNVYGQYGFWHLIRNNGRVSRIWSYDMGDREHPVHLPHLQHFVANWRPYTWVNNDGKPLDWQSIAADYDYIVLVAEDKALREEVGTHAHRALTVGAVSLYDLPPGRDLPTPRSEP